MDEVHGVVLLLEKISSQHQGISDLCIMDIVSDWMYILLILGLRNSAGHSKFVLLHLH